MANYEQLFVDGLGTNLTGDPAGTYVLEEIAFPPPKPRHEWVSAADSEGAALMRTPQHENREITAKVRIAQQATQDLMFDKIGTLLDKFAKARSSPDGIELAWIPTTSARTAIFTCLDGEVEEMPIGWGNGDGYGWLSRQAVLTLKMTCLPYWYGTETSITAVSSTDPIFGMTVPDVPGDIPALGRLVVTDLATQNRRYFEWGLEPKNNVSSFLIDSDVLTTSGYAGVQATTTGAYDVGGGNNSITVTMLNQPVAVAGTGNRTNIGTWRVRVRVNVTTIASAEPEDITDTHVRLAWRFGDGPVAKNRWTRLHLAKIAAWQEIDLGVINVPEALLGTQRWTGSIEVYNTSSTGTFVLDYIKMIPTHGGYGKARTTRPLGGAEVINGYDLFTGTTAAAVLNARVAPAGGTWATSGATTDFVFSDTMFGLATENVTRSTSADTGSPLGRVAVLGATNYTSVEAHVTSYVGSLPSAFYYWGVVTRWTDSSNYLQVYLNQQNGQLLIDQVVTGTRTRLASSTKLGTLPFGYLRVRAVVYASGQVYGFVELWDGTKHAAILSTSASTSVLATGGTLATGKIGFHDAAPTAMGFGRYYDDFYVGTPPAEQITIASGQSLEVRHDDVIREDSGGTLYGRPASYRGSRLLVPPEGPDSNVARILVHANRNDLDADECAVINDNLQAQLFYTPRGIAVPR